MGAGFGRALGLVAATDVAIQFACFVVAAALQTELFYDLSGSLTYILCVLVSLRRGGSSVRQRVNSALVMAWAARLGSFLFLRILRDGRDRRFDSARTNPRLFAIFWAVQAFWIFITALPVYTLNVKGRKSSDEAGAERGSPTATSTVASPLAPTRPPPGPGLRDAAGWALWAVGFVVQVTADIQKSRFKADPANDGRWIDVGLWRLSQHPNYFGEMSMWWGIFLSCSTELRGFELLSGISPIFVSYLLLRVSGVPLLRKAGRKRWGHLPAYLEYLRKTPLLLPLPRVAA